MSDSSNLTNAEYRRIRDRLVEVMYDGISDIERAEILLDDGFIDIEGTPLNVKVRDGYFPPTKEIASQECL